MVKSFGRPVEAEPELADPSEGDTDRVGVLLIKPVVDPEALRGIGELVRQTVAEAVRAGFGDAVGDAQDDYPPVSGNAP